MKGLSILAVAWITSLTVLAQQPVDLSQKNTWQTYYASAQLTIEYKVTDCHYSSDGISREEVHMRYTNHTNDPLGVNWHLALYYNGICKTCQSPQEYTYDLVLSPQQTLEATCNTQASYETNLFSKFLNIGNPTTLTSFEYLHLLVQPIE